MSKVFNNKGGLIIPIKGSVNLPENNIKQGKENLIVKEAYCSNGHSLISATKIDNENGINFIYTDKDGKKETDIVISSVVGSCEKELLKGSSLNNNDLVKILCPSCRTELPILLDCECGAPIYLFYIDKQLKHNYGQSLCSRIGCSKSSQLRFSQDVIRSFMGDYCF
jgi:hypothetical protein